MPITGTEVVAAVSAVIGVVLGKSIDGAFSRRKNEAEVKKTDAEVAQDLRDELRAEIDELRAEVRTVQKEVTQWQQKYYVIRQEYLLIRADLADALRQLEKFGVHVEMRPMSQALLDDLGLKYSDEQ